MTGRPSVNTVELLPGPSRAQNNYAQPCACQGGRSCVRENPATQSGGNAIPGLHSSFVGQRIIVMARPWQDNVAKHKLVHTFLRQGIAMILNLQEPGEHGGCGPGNLPASGFSYDPQPFTEAGIAFCNVGWPDMEVPELDKMMDIVQVMENVTAVEKRKLAVHCHTGLGRSCLAIACFFVWSGEYNAMGAAGAVRRLRPGALETTQQVGYVAVFEKYVMHMRCIFKPAASSPLLLPAAASSTQASGSGYAPAPLLPAVADGTQAKVDTNGVVTETFSNGLMIVRAVKGGAKKLAEGQSAGGGMPGGRGHDLGLDAAQPWNVHFHMSSQHRHPEPPRSYQEALARQQRLSYGADRLSFLHLHSFVKHAAFAVMQAAGSFYEALLAGHLSWQQQPQQQWQQAQPFSTYLPSYNGAYSGGVGSAAPLPSPPASFAHAVFSFIGQADDVAGPAWPAAANLEAMAQAPGFKVFVGDATSSTSLGASLAKVKQAANLHQYQVLSSAPVGVALLALQEFFEGLDPEVPSLSQRGLERMCATYTQLPFSGRADVPEDVQISAAAEVLIAPLPPSDQELLLLFAAMLRHIARASGPGCEPEVVQICRWLARLLLGTLASKPSVEEALCCYFWCLLRNDTMFAAAICCKAKRPLMREAAPAGLLMIHGFVPSAGLLELQGEREPYSGDWQVAAPQQQARLQGQVQAKIWSEAAYKKLAAKSIPGMSWFIPGSFSTSQGAAQKPGYRVGTGGQRSDAQGYGQFPEAPHQQPPSPGFLEAGRQGRPVRQFSDLPPGIANEPVTPIQRIVHYVWV